MPLNVSKIEFTYAYITEKYKMLTQRVLIKPFTLT